MAGSPLARAGLRGGERLALRVTPGQRIWDTRRLITLLYNVVAGVYLVRG